MYESPINVIYSDIANEISKDAEENAILTIRQAIGYDIDKDELIKALQYDRHQYEKGFNDARPKAKWISNSPYWWECSKCGRDIYSQSKADILEFHRFCGRCGAEMIKIESEIGQCY